MDEEEKKAIERFKANANYCITSKETTQTILNLIEKQQKELEKKDKIIDLMADRLEFVMKNSGIGLDPEHGMNFTINDIKQYFIKKADESNG